MQHKSIFHEFTENNLSSNALYFEHLNMLKKQIETFHKHQQLRILSIIYGEDQNSYTQNKNGIFINLSNLKLPIIQKVEDYAAYIVKQEYELKERETKITEFVNKLNEGV
jgi:hypothetical protein